MSSPHNFGDDPQRYPGPKEKSSNATAILIAIAIVCGTVMLICGGMIMGGVMMYRQAAAEMELVMQDLQTTDDMAFYTEADLTEYRNLQTTGNYAAALIEIDRALEAYPDDAMLHNEKSWLLATCPDANVRDGETAIYHGTQACELTGWTASYYVDTLAAAYAEAGDFEKAVEYQQDAIDLDPRIAAANDYYSRLELYKVGESYREGTPAAGGGGVLPQTQDTLSGSYVEPIVDDADDKSQQDGAAEPSATTPEPEQP